MAKIRKEALLLVLIKTVLFTMASPITEFERDWNITLNKITTDGISLGKDNIATYATCNDISTTERECILTYEFLHPEGFIFKNECYLNFSNDRGIRGINIRKIRAARKGKVIISYIDEAEMKPSEWATAYTTYRVIDTTTCKSQESKVLFNTTQLNTDLGDKFWEGNVFLYDDGTFDTFLAQKDLCDGARCKVTFGSDGQMIGQPASCLSNEMLAKDIRIFPVTDKNSYNDFFALVQELKNPRSNQGGLSAFKLMHQSATSSIADTLLDVKDVVNFDVDDSNGMLGICWSKINAKNHTIIECRQFNIANVALVCATFELPYLVKTLKVKNTWGFEELLLLTDKCKDDSCETDDGHYYIRVVNQQKPHSGIMEIPALNCPGELRKETSISVFNKNSNDNKICVSESCQNFVRDVPGKSHHNIKLIRECFGTKYIHESF